MISIQNLQAGMTVYDVHRTRMGNTTMKTWGEWPVFIAEVGDKWVIARWNGNPARKYFGTKFKWKKNKTIFISFGMSKRPATRQEIKDLKTNPQTPHT